MYNNLMNTKIVKNISEQDLTVVGVGIVKAGESVSVPLDFHNANFQEIYVAKKTETKTESKIDDEVETEKTIRSNKK